MSRDQVLLEEVERAAAPYGTALLDDYPLSALPVLVHALHREARLTPAGAAVAEQSIVAALTRLARVRGMRRQHPEIDRAPLGGPVFLTGIFRTGSTLLHHLLARHPDLRVPPLWQMLAPAGGGSESDLVRQARSYVDEYYRAAPAFREIHPLSADEPEECHRLTGNSLHADIYSLRYRIPNYADWLADRDMTAAYLSHQEQLRCLLWRYGAQNGGSVDERPVVLKCPSHMWHLATLAKAYPQARIVRLHRDPLRCLGSLCSLTEVVRSARSEQVDPLEIGRHWLKQVCRALVDVRPASTVHGLPVLDVDFRDLVAGPMRTMREVCEFIGVPMTEVAERRIAAYLARQRGGSGHRYALETYGLRPGDVAERLTGYRSAFGFSNGTQAGRPKEPGTDCQDPN